MSLEQLKNNLPASAKDIKINIGTVLSEEGAPGLNQKQIYGIALACAYNLKNNHLIEALLNTIQDQLSEAEIQATQSASIIMAMNNIYYRFVHLMEDKSYASMPARLRMSVIGNPGIDKLDFELSCLAVSALNGCGMCMEAHAHELVKGGLSKESVQSAVRIAAVLNAVNVAM